MSTSSSTPLPFKQVDVFTKSKFKGNPVAVFFEADHLSQEEMQAIANWTNLSETTFVQKPTEGSGADYRLRIFTPSEELPFAGHPTIGSAHAIIEAGIVKPKDGKLFQECFAGIVELKYNEADGKIEFKLPYYVHSEVNKEIVDFEAIAGALGIRGEQIEKYVPVHDGPHWFTIKLADANDVIGLKPNFSELKALSLKGGITGYSIFGKYNAGEYSEEFTGPVYEARNFFLLESFVEDPVCGSGAGADASVLAEIEGFEGEFVIKQGRKLGRDGSIAGRVEKTQNGSNDYSIFIGGNAITCINGTY
jgi:PhzF family phenazine biosynthesis protein